MPAINSVLRQYKLKKINKIEDLNVGDLTLVVGMPLTDPLENSYGYRYIGPVLWENPKLKIPGWFNDLPVDKTVIWLYPGNPQYSGKSKVFNSDFMLRASIELDKLQIYARSVALFFNPDNLIDIIAAFVFGNKLESVLGTAKRRMKFYGTTKNLLKDLLFEMINKSGMPQLTIFFKLMEVLCETKEYDLLAGEGYINTYRAKDNDRIDKVFKYVFQ